MRSATGGAKLAERRGATLGSEFAFTESRRRAMAGDRSAARYELPPGRRRLRDKRVALVDDVMSAGSSLRATLLRSRRAARGRWSSARCTCSARGLDIFPQRGVAVETIGRGDYEMWRPPECPLCAAGAPIEDAAPKVIMPTAIHRQVEAARQGELARVIARMLSGWAVLGDPQITRGYCLLLPDPVVADLNALTGDQRRQFLDDMAALVMRCSR